MTTHIAGHEGVGIVVAGGRFSSIDIDSLLTFDVAVGPDVDEDLLNSRVGVS